jgi:hypothetical protein
MYLVSIESLEYLLSCKSLSEATAVFEVSEGAFTQNFTLYNFEKELFEKWALLSYE